MRWAGAVLREVWAVSLAQRVASLMIAVTIAAMCLGIVLTTGRAEGARAEVLRDIDQAGTRSIVVRAQADAGLTPEVLDRIDAVQGIEWAAAFGPSLDVQNSAVPGRSPVSLRLVEGTGVLPEELRAADAAPPTRGTAFESATRLLGLADGTGSVADGQGASYAVSRTRPDRQELSALGPVVVVPTRDRAVLDRVSVLIVVTTSPELIAPVLDVLRPLLAVEDPTKVSVESSERLAAIRADVDAGLGSLGRTLLVVVFGFTALLVAAILYGTVVMRRKDFGRRRALGASQGLVFSLLMLQTLLLTAFSGTLSLAVAALVIAALGDPLPGASFLAALLVLVLALSLVSAALPAAFAARRDPLAELRVA